MRHQIGMYFSGLFDIIFWFDIVEIKESPTGKFEFMSGNRQGICSEPAFRLTFSTTCLRPN